MRDVARGGHGNLWCESGVAIVHLPACLELGCCPLIMYASGERVERSTVSARSCCRVC